jgi:Malectin domain/Fibronectin type III domain
MTKTLQVRQISIVLLLLTLCAVIPGSAAAQSDAVTVSLSPSTPGATIPSDFLGLSFEEADVLPSSNYVGGYYFVNTNQPLLNLFSTLGVKSLRIGGNTADSGPWPANADIDALFGFAQAANANVLYTLPLKTFNASAANTTASYIMSKYASSVTCFAIGNEANLYPIAYSTYATDAHTYINTISASNPTALYCGPAPAGGSEAWTAEFAQGFASTGKIKYATLHNYFGQNGGTTTGAAARNLMLGASFLSSYASNAAGFVPTVQSTGLQYRMEETNSFYDGGSSGASNTFAEALWVLDYSYWWANNSAEGINFHTGDSVSGGPAYYSFFTTTTGGYTIQPGAYGALAFNLGSHGSIVPVTLTNPSGMDLTAYGVLGTDNSLWVTIINKTHESGSTTANLTLNLGGGYSQGNMWLMQAPNNDDSQTTGITVGGAPITTTGTWSGTSTPVSVSGGTATLNLSAATAAVIQFLPVAEGSVSSIQINAGGPAVSPFVADEYFSGGATTTHANTINTSKVTNPAPAAVYQSGRDTTAVGPGTTFSYTVGGFTPGTNYLVRLHFCETYWTAAGKRTFNVSINGTQVLTNFDIFATAGGENIANIQQFTEPANSNGQFVILFTSEVNNALVSGIEIDSITSCSAPTAPSGLTATATSSSQISLSWTASSSSCSVTYNVFRSTTSGFTPSSSNQIASGVTPTTYSDTGLAASTSYYYLVEETNSGGTSAASNQATATTTSCTAPTAPSGLGATATSSSQINLSWTASSSSCGVTYNVFGSTTSGFTPSTSNQITSGVTATTYSNTGLTASTTYYYVVEATNSGGTSAASNQASATTSSAPSGPCTSICINSGGPAVSPFVADVDFSGGTTLNHANTINTSKVTSPAPAAVYQTARGAVTNTGAPGTTFSYTIGGFTAGASHTVRLHFCETYFTTAGSRVFNVSINGTQVLTNFDIEKTAGGENIANIQQFTEAANSSGQYVITFVSVTNNALISAIEID